MILPGDDWYLQRSFQERQRRIHEGYPCSNSRMIGGIPVPPVPERDKDAPVWRVKDIGGGIVTLVPCEENPYVYDTDYNDDRPETTISH